MPTGLFIRFSCRYETSFLNKFVDAVYNMLDLNEVRLPPNIVGMARHEKEINSWLDQHNLPFLVIYGMDGSGKSTLAKYIYNSNWRRFESVSFLEVHNGLVELQEKLLKDISCGKNRKIPHVSRGMPRIELALEKNEALIVLDDVTESKQLVNLLGTGEINSKSKIIVTTRENTDKWFISSSWKCQKYDMKLLNDDDSLELFCHHAFRSKKPMAGFEPVVQRAINYCEGNPMALEHLGSSLPMSISIEYLESQMRLRETDFDSRLQDVLLRRYRSLTHDTERELFLHIACFFNGIDMDYVGEILNPDYEAKAGIETQIDKGLLSVSSNKKLTMHRLFQEMGKNIVRQESTKLPAKRSRVWLSRDSYRILSKGKVRCFIYCFMFSTFIVTYPPI
ncbi:disease resistance protein RUN1-like [Bidens hawaiensis]|uniref:disease resistance protein RUN1-like n=1 Tax=Bidens hawaiensis TaxID=980011 RepID=UPI004048EB41